MERNQIFVSFQLAEDILGKANSYDKAMSENIELGLELKTVTLERDKLKMELGRVGYFPCCFAREAPFVSQLTCSILRKFTILPTLIGCLCV